MRIFLALGFVFLVTTNVTAELPDWVSLADKARWAANAHNVQSWVLESVPGRTDQRRLVLSPERLLPETDPPSRQLTISLGAFLAVLESEAAARGANLGWEALSSEPGALVTLKEGNTSTTEALPVDALTAATVKYRTTELVLDPSVLTAQEARQTATVGVRWLSNPAEVLTAKAWAQKAFNLEMDLPRTRDESIKFTRYGEAARRAQPWGITLVPNFPSGNLFWIETFAAWFPQSPTEYAKSAKDLLSSALTPVKQILVLTSKGNGNRERLETGVLLQRLWLDVRSRGGELLPLSQGLQEFPEMQELRTQAHGLWANDGETVQMVLALFKPAPGDFLPSPRLAAGQIVQ